MVMVGPALSQRSTNIYHSMQASIELIPHILEQHLEFPRDWRRFRRRESPAGRYERKSLFIDIPATGYIRLFLCFFFCFGAWANCFPYTVADIRRVSTGWCLLLGGRGTELVVYIACRLVWSPFLLSSLSIPPGFWDALFCSSADHTLGTLGCWDAACSRAPFLGTSRE